uniref:Secreted protein n=1 Tax=Phakopsora pachyrhizi TaxID=170000 RepID=A0A0S1MJD9_PHAPC
MLLSMMLFSCIGWFSVRLTKYTEACSSRNIFISSSLMYHSSKNLASNNVSFTQGSNMMGSLGNL